MTFKSLGTAGKRQSAQNTLKNGRKGSALIMALVVALVGGVMAAVIFEISMSFLGASNRQLRTYAEGIRAESYIERAKGEIMAANIAAGHVIHAPANSTLAEFSTESNKITSIDRLLVPINIPNEALPGRTVITRIYDANYMASRIDFVSSADYEDLPPSFFIDNTHSFNPANGNTGEHYPPPGTSTAGFDDLYNRYGVYLVQVKIVSNDLRPEGQFVIRKTEEVFVHLLPISGP